ncbi:tetratricopeptide repeat protein [Streptomyces fulvoviolaceus]|uniref:tetratricopeptide repeat protein n=1 Tax=Streptomyces fulvoviolaceus TaxID=285535 RepID=UPI0021BF71CA|nr:TIR domain-containing protein [Streptomyces fulvoviolaceus]MCT9081316.1 TIR domain-containing protein [Streptomyces fulvoviolaceus]
MTVPVLTTHTSEAGGAKSQWDVFVSYSRSDAQRAGVLAAALRDQGLRVFMDETAVDDFASITTTITTALARSRALLAVYSAEYPRRRACQWELTYAYLAGLREGDPRRRVLVVNPDAGTDHVQPVELRDARHWPWPAAPAALQRFAVRVAAHTSQLRAPMSGSWAATATGHAPSTAWLPAPARTGSARFTGRLTEQWHIHTALHRHHSPLVAPNGTGSSRAAQLRGMPGIGKSLLAQEYALRFGSAFPGGVFWFDLHTLQGTDPSTVLDAYAQQVSTVTGALGLNASDQRLPSLLSRMAVFLGEQGAPCLWVVDGLPDGLADEELHLLNGPHLLASTLITTRSLRYTTFAEPIDVPPLPEPDSLHLLTARHHPRDEAERAAATALVHDVGGHPHALDILAETAATTGFARTRNRLHAPGPDILGGPLTTALLPHPLTGRTPTADLLRLLAIACPAPLTPAAMEGVLGALPPYDPWETAALVTHAVDSLLGTGSLTPGPSRDGSWTVHPLLARTARRRDDDTARQEDLRRVLLHVLTEPAKPSPAASTAPHTHQVSRKPPTAPVLGPGPLERSAAFNLQIELVTRVGVQPLPPEEGSLREALTSLHTLFATTREVLHQMAAEAGTPIGLPHIASNVINEHLRPFLTTWHTALQQHEVSCPPDLSAIAHEHHWARAMDMRAALDALRVPLTDAARELGRLCGIDLLAAPTADDERCPP